jgi:hypothetical protein
LAQAALGVSAPVNNLVLNEVGHPVSGKVTVNGALPSKGSCFGNSTDDAARVVFSDSAQRYSASIPVRCNTTDFGFSTVIPAGTYEVRVERSPYTAADPSFGLLPVAYLAQAALGVSASVTNLVLNEVGHPVSGKVTVNGALPSKGSCLGNSIDEAARVVFLDPSRRYSASIPIRCNTLDFGFSTVLPAGTYEVRVERSPYTAPDPSFGLLPVSYLAQAALGVSAPVNNLVLNEVGYAVSGKVTVNGAPPSKGSCFGNSTDDAARVVFSDSAQRYSASIPIRCNTTDFGFSTVLPAGTYEVRVERSPYTAADPSFGLLPIAYLGVGRLAVP